MINFIDNMNGDFSGMVQNLPMLFKRVAEI